MNSISEQILIYLRVLVPYLVIFVFFILNIVSVSSSALGSIEVPFLLMIIYYWSIYRPGFISALFVFLVGLCFDLLSGLPIGLHSFIFLILKQFVSEQRLFLTGQPFVMIWLGFVFVSGLAFFIEWFLFGVISGLQWTSLLNTALMWGAGSFCFPLISVILILSHKTLPPLPDQYSAVK